MKANQMKILFLILSLYFCMACHHQPEKMISISYTAVDSNIELTRELTIRADSILFTSINHLGTQIDLLLNTSTSNPFNGVVLYFIGITGLYLS